MWKKRIFALVLAVAAVCSFSACGEENASSPENEKPGVESALPQATADPTPRAAAQAAATLSPAPSPSASPEATQPAGEGETVLRIDAGGQVFFACLEDTEAAKALGEMLPMSLEMSDWQGNAKRFQLPSVLPEKAEEYPSVSGGALMLEGSGTLCLFYQEDSQGGTYTPIGEVEEPEGLAQALAGDRVEVSFQLVQQ